MKLKDIIDFLENKIPQELTLDFDDVGFKKIMTYLNKSI